jgi:hypothetical protein
MEQTWTESLEKVWEAYRNDQKLLDYIYVGEGFDHNGDHYLLFEDWDSQKKFVALAIETLGLDSDTADYELEKELGAEFVFTDEYNTCDDCAAIVRTAPSSYHWQPDFYVGDGFLVCGECFRNETDYQEDYLRDRINNPKNAINGLLSEEQLEELGFEKLQGNYESGWHPGQTDKPELIFDRIKDDYDEIVFLVDGVSQFYITFSVWVRE